MNLFTLLFILFFSDFAIAQVRPGATISVDTVKGPAMCHALKLQYEFLCKNTNCPKPPLATTDDDCFELTQTNLTEEQKEKKFQASYEKFDKASLAAVKQTMGQTDKYEIISKTHKALAAKSLSIFNQMDDETKKVLFVCDRPPVEMYVNDSGVNRVQLHLIATCLNKKDQNDKLQPFIHSLLAMEDLAMQCSQQSGKFQLCECSLQSGQSQVCDDGPSILKAHYDDLLRSSQAAGTRVEQKRIKAARTGVAEKICKSETLNDSNIDDSNIDVEDGPINGLLRAMRNNGDTILVNSETTKEDIEFTVGKIQSDPQIRKRFCFDLCNGKAGDYWLNNKEFCNKISSFENIPSSTVPQKCSYKSPDNSLRTSACTVYMCGKDFTNVVCKDDKIASVFQPRRTDPSLNNLLQVAEKYTQDYFFKDLRQEGVRSVLASMVEKSLPLPENLGEICGTDFVGKHYSSIKEELEKKSKEELEKKSKEELEKKSPQQIRAELATCCDSTTRKCQTNMTEYGKELRQVARYLDYYKSQMERLEIDSTISSIKDIGDSIVDIGGKVINLAANSQDVQFKTMKELVKTSFCLGKAIVGKEEDNCPGWSDYEKIIDEGFGSKGTESQKSKATATELIKKELSQIKDNVFKFMQSYPELGLYRKEGEYFPDVEKIDAYYSDSQAQNFFCIDRDKLKKLSEREMARMCCHPGLFGDDTNCKEKLKNNDGSELGAERYLEPYTDAQIFDDFPFLVDQVKKYTGGDGSPIADFANCVQSYRNTESLNTAAAVAVLSPAVMGVAAVCPSCFTPLLMGSLSASTAFNYIDKQEKARATTCAGIFKDADQSKGCESRLMQAYDDLESAELDLMIELGTEALIPGVFTLANKGVSGASKALRYGEKLRDAASTSRRQKALESLESLEYGEKLRDAASRRQKALGQLKLKGVQVYSETSQYAKNIADKFGLKWNQIAHANGGAGGNMIIKMLDDYLNKLMQNSKNPQELKKKIESVKDYIEKRKGELPPKCRS